MTPLLAHGGSGRRWCGANSGVRNLRRLLLARAGEGDPPLYLFAGEADNALYLLGNHVGVGGREVYLVDDGHEGEVVFQREVGVR